MVGSKLAATVQSIRVICVNGFYSFINWPHKNTTGCI